MWTIGWEALQTLVQFQLLECQSPLASSFPAAPSLLESLLVLFLLPTLKQRHLSCILLLSICIPSWDWEVHMDFNSVSRLWLLSLKKFSSSTLCPCVQIHLPTCQPDISFWMLLWFRCGLIPPKLTEIWFLMVLEVRDYIDISLSQKWILATISCYAVSSCHGYQLAPPSHPEMEHTTLISDVGTMLLDSRTMCQH